MANKWVEFVRDFAKRNNVSYMCAVSKPECKAEYRAKYGNPKKLSQKKEREMMGAQDIDVKPPMMIRVKKTKKTKKTEK